ncbi:hypothetical protein AAII07_39400 [Microvirga sp. 0TCS3.31]
MLAANLLGILLSAHPVLAESPVREPEQEIATASAGPATDRSGPTKSPVRKPQRKPDGAGNFIYELINQIQVQSKELCSRYGNPADCLEEAEVCLTMRDTEDNTVRLCLNTTPGESEGEKGTAQKSRVRR